MPSFKQDTTVAGATTKSGATNSTGSFPETPDIETSSEEYALRFSGTIGKWLLDVQEQATLKMLASFPNCSVLDVGGGHGQLTPALVDGGYKVTVLSSHESCEKRVSHFTKNGLCQFVVGDVLDLPYPDDAFDIVISYRFLAHVSNWQKFLSELNRVASKAVIVDYPTIRSVNFIAPALFKFKKNIEQTTRPYVSYNERQIFNYLYSIGSLPDERYAQFFWPMVLHRMMKSPQGSSLIESLARWFGVTSIFGSPVILKSIKSRKPT
jgi:ubiquinone/menaquinone biosynthesis C-methylase UbiE